jgi:Ca2+-binding EF-hand superfamily protein
MERLDALEPMEDESVQEFHLRLEEARELVNKLISEGGDGNDHSDEAAQAEAKAERIAQKAKDEARAAREAKAEMEEVLRQLSELAPKESTALDDHKLHHLLMPAEPINVSVGKTDAECTEIFCEPGKLSWPEQKLPDHYEARFRAAPDVEQLALAKMSPHGREVYYIATKKEKQEMIDSLHVAMKPPWSSSDWMEPVQLRQRALTKQERQSMTIPAKLPTVSHLGEYLPVLLVHELHGSHYLATKEIHERAVYKQTMNGAYFMYFCELDKLDEPNPEKRQFWAVGSVLGQTGTRGVVLRAYCTATSPLLVPKGGWLGFNGASFVEQPLTSLTMDGAVPPKGLSEPIALSHLEMDMNYEVQLRAKNFYGTGEFGPTFRFKTSRMPTPPPPPAHLEVVNLGFGQMSVCITPADSDGGSPVTYWNVSCFLDEKLVHFVKVLPLFVHEETDTAAAPAADGEQLHKRVHAVPASEADFSGLQFGHVYSFTAYACNEIGEGVSTDAVQILVADDTNWFCNVCARMNPSTSGSCKVCATKADYNAAASASGTGLAALCALPLQLQGLIDRLADGDDSILELPIDAAQVGTEGFVRLCGALDTANNAHDPHYNKNNVHSAYDGAHDTGGPVCSLRLFCSNHQTSYGDAAKELVAGAEELATAYMHRTGGNHGPFAPAGADEFENAIAKSVVASSMETAVMAELDQQLKATKIETRGLAALTKTLQVTKSLTYLQMVNCALDDDVAAMLALVLWENTTITSTDLSNNLLTDDGVRAIGEGLGTIVNCTLTSLDLSYNKIKLGGAGVIDSDAFAAQFKAEDLDGDGTVSLDELKVFRKRLEGEAYDPIAVEKDFAKYDVDGDGSMSLHEYLEHARAAALVCFAREFTEEDTDGDGIITLEELKRFRKRAEGASYNEETVETDFKQFDINGDGDVSLEEYMENARDAAHIKYILQNSSTLTHLKLDHNPIGDEGAASIALGLLPNPAVEELQHLLQPGGQTGSAVDLLDDPEEVRRYEEALLSHRPPHSLLGAPAMVNLSLIGTKVGLEGFLKLGISLRSNRTIRRFKLEVNGAKLGSVLQLLPRLYDETEGDSSGSEEKLTVVAFENEPIADIGVSALSQGLHNNRSVHRLQFDAVRATDRSIEELAQTLAVNATLTSVSLCANSLSDMSAINLARAMYHNDTLRTLRLSGNRITNRGGEEWATLLRSPREADLTPAGALANLDFHLNQLSVDLLARLDFLVLHRPTLTALAQAVDEGAGEEYYGDEDEEEEGVFRVQLPGQDIGMVQLEELVLAMGVAARTTSAIGEPTVH